MGIWNVADLHEPHDGKDSSSRVKIKIYFQVVRSCSMKDGACQGRSYSKTRGP